MHLLLVYSAAVLISVASRVCCSASNIGHILQTASDFSSVESPPHSRRNEHFSVNCTGLIKTPLTLVLEGRISCSAPQLPSLAPGGVFPAVGLSPESCLLRAMISQWPMLRNAGKPVSTEGVLGLPLA